MSERLLIFCDGCGKETRMDREQTRLPNGWRRLVLVTGSNLPELHACSIGCAYKALEGPLKTIFEPLSKDEV